MVKSIGNIDVPDKVRKIASGAISQGDVIVLKSDGTVEAVSETSNSAGTPTAVTDTAGNKLAAAYDTTNQKVVLAWYDAGNSDKGTAVVGTVSGDSITFGTETVFENADTDDLYMIYEPNAGKVVIAYKDVGNSSYGTAIVGTVSGTSISFGTATVFESAQSSEFSMSFDAAQNKVLIVYKDVINNQYGTAIVGTVSGTSISFGSATVFDSSTVQQTTTSYDSVSEKHLVCWGESSSPNQGKGAVATISGTSVSFGSSVVFTDSGRSSWITSQPVGNGKVLVAYCDNGDTDRGKLIVGTVSGTSVTFGSNVQFDEGDIVHIHSALDTDSNRVIVVYSDEDTDNSHYGKFVSVTVNGTTPTFAGPTTFESAYTERPAVAYDSNAGKAVVAYQDQGNSSYVTACVLTGGGSTLKDTFLGFAESGVADGDSVVINSACSIDRNQTGLTAGQTIYVQSDGTLGTTADTPSVVAGTAISSTDIIVKG